MGARYPAAVGGGRPRGSCPCRRTCAFCGGGGERGDPSPFYLVRRSWWGTRRRVGPLRQRVGRAGWSSYPTGVLRARTFQSCLRRRRRRCSSRFSCRRQLFELPPLDRVCLIFLFVRSVCRAFVSKPSRSTSRYRRAFPFYRHVRSNSIVRSVSATDARRR